MLVTEYVSYFDGEGKVHVGVVIGVNNPLSEKEVETVDLFCFDNQTVYKNVTNSDVSTRKVKSNGEDSKDAYFCYSEIN